MKRWAKAGDLEPGTKVHIEQMAVSLSTLEVGPSRVARLYVGDRVVVDKGKRRERELVELVTDSGRVFRRTDPRTSVALGWDA